LFQHKLVKRFWFNCRESRSGGRELSEAIGAIVLLILIIVLNYVLICSYVNFFENFPLDIKESQFSVEVTLVHGDRAIGSFIGSFQRKNIRLLNPACKLIDKGSHN
jgi:hypothetical protein